AHIGEERYRTAALAAIAPLQEAMAQAPLALARLLNAADFALDPPRELVLIGEPGAPATTALRRVAAGRFLPNLATASATPEPARGGESPLLGDRPQREGKPTAYYCERYVCKAPVTDPDALAALLA